MNTQTKGRVESWCFTWNNYTKESEDIVKALGDADWVQYVSAGYEKAPTTGTPHIQGYFKCKRGRGKSKRWVDKYLSDKKTFTSVQEDGGIVKKYGRAATFQARACAELNERYTQKDDNICVVKGDFPRKGARNDLQLVADRAEEGLSIRDQIEMGTVRNAQHLRMAEGLQRYYEPERAGVTMGIWIHGPSGSGKSRTARALANKLCPGDVFTKNDGTGKWFDGMDGQECIIWNDFRYDTVKPSLFFDMLDEGPLRVEVKGHTRQFRAKYVIFTSDKSVTDTFTSVFTEELYQFQRRVPVETKLQKNRLTKAHIQDNMEGLMEMILKKESE